MEDCEGTEDRASVSHQQRSKKPNTPLSEETRRGTRESDRRRSRTRVNLGPAYSPWKNLRDKHGFKTDAEMAFFLLNIYLRTKSETRLERPSLEKSSSTETCESMHCEHPFMSSPNEAEQETCGGSPLQSPVDVKPRKKDAALARRAKSQHEWTIKQSENKENQDIEEDEDEEFSTSLSVGDGNYLVDLGSPSEFIVDEECILQLFKCCRACSRQCTVRKNVKGLKLVVYQDCFFCRSRCKWTNLPDDDDDKDDSDFQMIGRDAALGQTNTTMSPSSNTS